MSEQSGLAMLRIKAGMTLREVEKAVGGRFSNALLSQMETGKIKRPSATVLIDLARVYGVPFKQVANAAGVNPDYVGDDLTDNSGRPCAVIPPAERQVFRPMDTWDRRNETVMLLIDYREDGDHALDDADIAITVGHNNDHNVGEGEGQGWQFAGWCWTHDHYVGGKGKPVGWMPLPHILARAHAAFGGEPAPATTPAHNTSQIGEG